ncbi:MAG: pyridoxine 5'-phosphate synthase [Desulfobacterales bacterium]|nr:pyridoxine 5'-phosphate synthase [Desulfobacterales bacterium]
MTRLLVNVDPVAALRQTDQSNQPDPVAAALQAELGGADGIAAHLRGDRGHTRERDIRLLRQTVQTRLVLRLAPAAEAIGMAMDFKPDMVTLVPPDNDGHGPAGGLDLMTKRIEIAEMIDPLKNSGIPVCLLIDPDPDQVKLAHKLDADAVEIATRAFGEAASAKIRSQILDKITDTVKLARRLRMEVHAGQGLDYLSVQGLAPLKEIDCFCIGHSIVARAVLIGMVEAVREMRRRIRESAWSKFKR